ncbi:MAG: hypothetical protein JNK74_03855 [Candidatus Hydrogenedentes bacterium]|nr:hypothetical protein [Candidatus Hydrogenedentota bacterium]
MRNQIRLAFFLVLCGALALCGCAVPKAIGKTAGGIVKGAGKVVSGTAKAVTKPLR